MKRRLPFIIICIPGIASAQCEPQWSTIATTDGPVRAIASYNGELVIGGAFTTVNGQNLQGLAASGDGGTTWHALGGHVISYDNGPGMVECLLARPDGLYVGGLFRWIGNSLLDNIGRWNGTQWNSLDQGIVNGEVINLYEFKGELVLSGYFFTVNQQYASHVIRWNGAAWNYFDPYALHSHGVSASCAWGSRVMASGTLTEASNVIQWDGSEWTDFPPIGTFVLNTLAGLGNELFAGKSGTNTQMVLRSSGGAWQETGPLPVPPGTSLQRVVYTLGVFNGQMYAGGSFVDPSGVAPSHIARWDGAQWQAVGTGPGSVVRSIATIDGQLWAGCLSRVARYACPCYVNCDNSTSSPLLTANDFQCFLNQFAAGSTYANCDASSGSPALTANDFQCFLNKFAAGCP